MAPGALGDALPRLGAAVLAGLAGAVLSGIVAPALPVLPGLIAAGCAGMIAVAATLWLMDRWLGLGLGAMLRLVFNRSGA
jgi:hypothetical protein